MEQTLSYVIVTPYTVAKCRAGGILSRLLSRLDLELAGAQLFAMSDGEAREYAEKIRKHIDPNNKPAGELLAGYVEKNFGPSSGKDYSGLMLLFRGADTVQKLVDLCGHLDSKNKSEGSSTGETIRDTYADLIADPKDPALVSYFEPAVLTPRSQADADESLAFFSKILSGKKNTMENVKHPHPEKIQRTLVIIKPDNWTYASLKPGAIIDMFSKTGLRIAGIKVHRFSVAQALDFYGPVEEVLKSKLSPVFGKKAKETLEREFGITLGEKALKLLEEGFGVEYAEDQFQQIVEFMAGIKPKDCPKEEIKNPGRIKCMIIVYEGEDAIAKIRDVLGPTDPLKAPGGTVRREFGSSVMVNTAHASDSPESYNREKDIVKVEENTLLSIISQ